MGAPKEIYLHDYEGELSPFWWRKSNLPCEVKYIRADLAALLPDAEPKEEICSKCKYHNKTDGYCYEPHGGISSWINENGVYKCTGFIEKDSSQIKMKYKSEPKHPKESDTCGDLDDEVTKFWNDHALEYRLGRVSELDLLRQCARHFAKLQRDK